MTSFRPRLHVLALDEGCPSSLDGLAVSLAVFGRGRLELALVPDRETLRHTAGRLVDGGDLGVVVVDVDHHPEPKAVLADAAELGYPLVVLSDGHLDTIQDHALSVAAAGYLPTTLPGRELVACLETLAAPPDHGAAWRP